MFSKIKQTAALFILAVTSVGTGCGGADGSVDTSGLVGTWYGSSAGMIIQEEFTISFAEDGTYTKKQVITHHETSGDVAGCVATIEIAGTFSVENDGSGDVLRLMTPGGTRVTSGCVNTSLNEPKRPIDSYEIQGYAVDGAGFFTQTGNELYLMSISNIVPSLHRQ